MSINAQKVCISTGLVLVGLFFIGFWPVAGFLTPPSPEDSPQEILEMFDEDRNRIRVGLMMSMFAAAMLVPWTSAIFVQLRRAEGQHSPLPYVVMLCNTLFSLEFLYLIMFWQVAAFREDADPESVRTLNDMAWIPFVGLTSTAVVMAFALGFSMLGDKRATPVFPRWAGYFNIWTAFMFTPGSLCIFFKDGPFAWDGVLAWYMPVSVFAIWVPVNTYLVWRAINQQQSEGVAAPAGGDPNDVAAELAAMRQELARLSAASPR